MTFGPLLLDAVKWTPHAYQRRAVDFLLSRDAAALWIDMGLGKSSIVLEAFRQLKGAGRASRMIVVAPLMPLTETWPYEVRKWSQFRHLSLCLLHGPKKLSILRGVAHKADITLVNYEGLAWLQKHMADMPQYDIVAYDEASKIKNSRSLRSKAVRKLFWQAQHRWQLTGTPAPNGYEDVFGQILAIDRGEALGKTLSEFRSRYYQPHPYKKYQWDLLPGSVERIEARIAPLVLRMAAEDYLDLPERIDDIRRLHMSPDVAKQYRALKKDMLLSLPGGTITAANAAALYTKLSQLANGALYKEGSGSGPRKYISLHDAKIDALAEMREELGDKQLLVCYEFRSDLARIAQRMGGISVLSSSMPKAERAAVLAAWNSGELKTLFISPASAGHGLNLQGSGAHHICWFSATWNLELYEQAIARLLRQGNRAASVINHVLCMADTIDELKLSALGDKDADQDRLLDGLRAELEIGESPMAIRKLGQPKVAEDASTQPAAVEEAAPQPKVAPAATESGSTEHREKIRQMASVVGGAKSAFSADIQAKIAPKPAEPAPAQRAPKPAEQMGAIKQAAEPKPAEQTQAATPKQRLDAIVDMFRAAVESVTRL